MQTRRDGSISRDKGERTALTKGAPLEGSSGRTKGDVRFRRGPQSEQEVHQRFHPDDFEVDSEQRVRLQASSVGAQAAVIPDDGTTSLSGSTAAYVNVALGAATTQVGDYISVDTAGDHFTLKGGSVYLVTADVVYAINDTNTYTQTTTKLSSSSTVYDTRIVNGQERDSLQPRITARVSAVVDLSSGGSEDLDLQGAGNDSDGTVNGTAGSLRITIQRIG